MKKALAGIVVITFVGLICTSLLALLNGAIFGDESITTQALQNPYFMAY